CGSKILKGFIPPYECTAVQRILDCGGVLLGKTNLDEFAMGSSCEHSAFGPVRNPWDPQRVPGGSSGGSAAAVASGQVPLALGTDTGGSIRQPAAFTGTLGLKPTYGRVSRYGAVAYASSFDQIGPFGRTPRDLALLLQAIAGKDPNDSTSMHVEVPDYVGGLDRARTEGLKGLRVGVPKEQGLDGVQEDIRRSYQQSLTTLEQLGASVVEVSLPHLVHALATYYIIVPAEASSNLARYDGVRYGHRTERSESLEQMYCRTRAEGFGPEVKRRIMMGSFVLSSGYYEAYYRRAQQVRTLIINDYKAAFANFCDVIATPVSPTAAFKLGERMHSPLEMYLADVLTVPINLAGLPALSLPCGLDPTGLPVGLQLIAPPFQELRLLQAAESFLQQQPFDVLPLKKDSAFATGAQ
ncbi:MAG: Asp-tRNA(Asn)/Glu-tRNA(Gln) amidotransferase subunit GatA, partial [Bdellovibrionales bacterium]|nr:Asp-tRNA(Asn)/Glu-tRNA(Gln) amidotransferase subunit GatA [Bdellovibrionales bacterium]